MKKDLTEFVARLKLLLIAMVLIVGSCMVALYILTPNPSPRTMVRLHNEDIITADGISSDHWLTECKSVGIPVKVNSDSGGKPNGIPERRRTAVGAERRCMVIVE